MYLYLDQREQHIIPLFPNLPFIKKKTLQTGDFMITSFSSLQPSLKPSLHFNEENEGNKEKECEESEEKILYLFERKTLKDLSASLKDGRFTEQKTRLLEAAKTIKVFYIIEGSLGYAPETLIEGIAFSKLNAAINKIYIEGLGVVRTKDKENTVQFLLEFYKSVERHYPKEMQGGSIKIVTEKKIVSNEELKEKIFQALPGIGPTLLPSLKSYSLVDLFKLSQSDIENIKYTSGRRVGKKSADIIHALLPGYNQEFERERRNLTENEQIERIKALKGDNKASIKILAEFPGISKKTAEYMLTQYSLAQIIFTEPSELENFMRSPSKRFGPALAKKINVISSFK